MLRLLAFEERLGLFELRTSGAPVWEYLRLRVFYELVRTSGALEMNGARRRPTLREAVGLARGVWESLQIRVADLGQREIVFFGYSRRVQDRDGLWCDPHVDPLLADLPTSHIYVEQRHRRRRYRPIAGTIFSHDYFDARVATARRFSKFRLRCCERTALNLVARELAEEFGTHLDLADLATALLDRRRHLIPLYRRFFEATGARLLVVVSPNVAESAAIEAARAAGVRSAELQHGVIAPLDPCYSYPAGSALQCRADDLLLLDRRWRHNVREFRDTGSVHVVGYSHFENARPRINAAKRTPQVVFLSQPTIGAALSRFAVELSRDPRFRTPIVYRLHPEEADWRNAYPWLVDAPITVDDGRQASLYELMARSDIQVGAYSFALYEGAALGLTTFVVDLPGSEAVADLVADGLAQSVVRPDDVVRAAESSRRAAVAGLFQFDPQNSFRNYLRTIGIERPVPSLPAGLPRSA